MVYRELGREHVGPFLLWYLFKILMGWAVGFVVFVVILLVYVLTCCLLCCVSALPIVGPYLVAYLFAVILLPVYVFLRCYSLAFIEQYGPDWRVFAYDLEPAPAGPSAPPSAPSAPNEETNA